MLFVKKQALLLLALFCALLGVATLVDLPLSQAIAHESSVFGKVMEVLGEAPALLFAAFCVAIFFARFCHTAPSPKVWGGRIGFALLTYGCCYYPIHSTCGYLEDYGLLAAAPLWAELLLALPLTALWLYGGYRFFSSLPQEKRASACKIALTVILSALTVLVSVLFLKFFFSRIRFRQLSAMGDFSQFTPWFVPRFFADSSHVSFPSGHTANACVIFLLSLFFPKKKTLVRSLLFAWIALCAFSRIYVGAHFLSDVVFSAALCLTICALFCKKLGVTPETFL